VSTLDVAYVGFGEFGRQIANLVRQVYSPASETFFDDTIYAGARPGALPFGDHCQEQHAQKSFFVCLGYKHAATKRRVLRALLDLGRSVPALVHPTAYVDHSAELSPGVVLFPNCTVDMNVRLGVGAVLHNACAISHDCFVGECCYLSPSATLCGRVKLGDECFLGAGVLVSNDVSIASCTTLALGSVVTRSIETPGLCAIGNPLKILDTPLCT
jgi:sugar O-acyltransferase (sialic acid O-acetyltransferase NeuD family)